MPEGSTEKLLQTIGLTNKQRKNKNELKMPATSILYLHGVLDILS
jgi:hypothetical protein